MVIFLHILYYASTLFCAILAIYYRKELAGRRIGFLVPYLVYVFLQEITLHILSLTKVIPDVIPNNYIVYNLYRPLSVVIFMLVYYRTPLKDGMKKPIYWSTIIFLAFTVVNYIFFESIFGTSTYMPILRALVITFHGMIFLFYFFQLDSRKEERFWQPILWITIGLVIFYPVSSIALNLQDYLRVKSVTVFGMKLYNLIPQVMSVFMYGCFCYAFYLCRKIK
jgi:hypothetical protein